MIQLRDSGSLDYVSSDRNGDKCRLWVILGVQLTRFTNRLNRGLEKSKESRMIQKAFGLSNWENELTFTDVNKEQAEIGGVVGNQEFGFTITSWAGIRAKQVWHLPWAGNLRATKKTQ